MDGSVHGCVDGSTFVNRFADNVDDSSQSAGSHRHHDGTVSVLDSLSSDKSLSGVQSDGSDVVSSQVLSHLEHESVLRSLYLESVQNGRQVAFELHVHYCTNNLRNLSHVYT